MRLWSNGAPATEIMYDKEGSTANVRALSVDPGQTYFMSSEALCSYPYMLEALSERFTISHFVLTVRMPVPLVLSEYCWTGWLYRASHQVHFPGRLDSMKKTIDDLSKIAPVTLCPIEPSGFASRFCRAVAGKTPDDLEQFAKDAGDVNVSIPPSLAEALHEAIAALNMEPIPGPMRRFFVNAAMENRGPDTFKQVLPRALHDKFNDISFFEGEIQRYDDMLADSGIMSDIRAEARAASRERLKALAELPPVDQQTKRMLQEQAQVILQKVREANPDALTH